MADPENPRPKSRWRRERIQAMAKAGGPEATSRQLDITPREAHMVVKAQPPLRPMNSLLASAARLNSTTVGDPGFRKSAAQNTEWQQDAWAMFDLIGEVRFLVDNLSARASKARFYVGKVGPDLDQPELVKDPKLTKILDSLGDGFLGLGRLVERMFANLKVPGEGWFVGVPAGLLPDYEDATGNPNLKPDAGPGVMRRIFDRSEPTQQPDNITVKSIEDYKWFMLSVSELDFSIDGTITVNLGPSEIDKIKVNADDIYLIRVWKPHPQFMWQADSATRSNLPVMRELVGLTMDISAQVDSRLAGAGVFIVPESASRAVKRQMGLPDDSDEDPFTDALMQSMLTPIADRAAASALVPLVITVPDDVADKFQHISFNRSLDNTSIELRKEAVERLAMGLDAPPELLLGTDRMNHWGGWLMREDVVRAHLEPGLALICDALTSQFLWPVAKANEIEDWDSYVIWYSVEHMIMNTDRGKDALDLFDRKILSDATTRAANGFDDTDAPQQDDAETQATEAVMAMIEANPALLQFPGADVLYRQVVAVLQGQPLTAADYNGEVQEDTQVQEAAGIQEAHALPKSPMPEQRTTNVTNTENISNEGPNSSARDDGSLPEPRSVPGRGGPPAFRTQQLPAHVSTSLTAAGVPGVNGEATFSLQRPPGPGGIRTMDPATLGVRGTYSNGRILHMSTGEQEQGASEDGER